MNGPTRQTLRALTSFLSALLALCASRTASACPVCFDAKQETMNAFRMSTVMLSVLPLLMIGGLIFWVVRRVRNAPGNDLGPEQSRQSSREDALVRHGAAP